MTKLFIDTDGNCSFQRPQREGEIAIEVAPGHFVSMEDLGVGLPDNIIPAPYEGMPVDQWGHA